MLCSKREQRLQREDQEYKDVEARMNDKCRPTRAKEVGKNIDL